MYLSVDGGGTKTSFALMGGSGEVLATETLGTSHYAQAGIDGARKVLTRGVAWARATAEHLESLEGIGFGICGYGENPKADEMLAAACRELAGSLPSIVVNDVDAAWAASLDCQDGIVIIAGTGSIALGVRGERSRRCGGWDYEIGDEGSGGWLGKELLRAFTRQADGRDQRGPLYQLVRNELGFTSDFDVIAFAHEHLWDRGRISQLAPLVSTAAAAGDASALGIFERAAREEADLVRAIGDELFSDMAGARDAEEEADAGSREMKGRDAGTQRTMEGTWATGQAGDRPFPYVPVSYIGGTFAAGNLVLEPLRKALPPWTRLRTPVHDAGLGAGLLLMHRLENATGKA